MFADWQQFRINGRRRYFLTKSPGFSAAWTLIAVWIAGQFNYAFAAIRVPLNVPSLTSQSDLIVRGQVVSVDGPVNNEMRGHVRVDHVLKGDWMKEEVTITYPVPRPLGLLFDNLKQGEYGVFFLKQGGTTPVDPQNIKLLTSKGRPNASLDPSSPLSLVREEILFTLSQPPSSVQVEAALQLGYFPAEPRSIERLTELSISQDRNLRGAAIVSLMRLNQIEALNPAIEYVLQAAPQQQRFRDYQAFSIWSSLVQGISGVRDSKAIEPLSELLEHKDVELRRMAASALSHMEEGKAIPTLAHALNDTDQNVRYRAVMGLSGITLNRKWGPAYAQFKENEQKYLDFWKQWWETEGKAEFADQEGQDQIDKGEETAQGGAQ